MDTAAVRVLFADYGPGFTRTAAELQTALQRHGYAGPLADWLPSLREAGLREPRRGVYGAPPEIPATVAADESADNRQITDAGASANSIDISCLPADNSNTTVVEPLAAPAAEPPRFSYFRGGIRTACPHADITPRQLWEVISGSNFASATARLREAPAGSEARAERKKLLDYVTPAGTFAPTRANSNLVTTSGLLVLDFDHLPDVPTARATLLADALLSPALVLLFTSPGGEGLKAILETDPRAAHLDNFRVLSAYLGGTYGPELQPDPSGKDVARACFVCHDAGAWLSPRFTQ
jgi:hypothetical protein